MKHQQILEQMLAFSLQQHEIKDATIAELQKKLDAVNNDIAAQVPPKQK